MLSIVYRGVTDIRLKRNGGDEPVAIFPQVATFLLCLAFLYDIFWVFISPQLFGESVMVKVATGGEITQDPSFCEKYPTTSGCQVRFYRMLILFWGGTKGPSCLVGWCYIIFCGSMYLIVNCSSGATRVILIILVISYFK